MIAVACILTACGRTVAGSVVPPPLDAPTGPTAPSTDPTSPSPTPSSEPSSAIQAAAPGPTVTDWGRDGRLLSIVVRNDDAAEIVYARVRVTVLAEDGSPIMHTIGERFSKATTILGLPPGDRYGLALRLPRGAPAVGSVQATYVEHSLRRAHTPTALRIGTPTLSHRRSGAVVSVRFTATGGLPPLVGAQAFLVDRRGRLVAVISGRFYCFGPTTRRTLRMQLLRPVPPHTRVATVLAYPVPRSAPLPLPAVCR